MGYTDLDLNIGEKPIKKWAARRAGWQLTVVLKQGGCCCNYTASRWCNLQLPGCMFVILTGN